MAEAAPSNSTSPAFCRACGYDLSHSPVGPCPECSRPFDPSERRSFDTRRFRTRRLRTIRRVLALAGTLAVIFAFAPRGYFRADATLLDSAGAPVITGTAIVLLAPRWLGGSYGLWSTSTDTPPAPFPASTKLSFRLSTERRRWLPWTSIALRSSTGSIAAAPGQFICDGSQTSGELALRCARPVARLSVEHDSDGLMTYEFANNDPFAGPPK